MNTTITPEDGNLKSRGKGNVPTADIDFGTVVTNVATKWNETESISLIWTTASEFNTQATAYNTELSIRNQVGGGRPQITKAMNVLDATMVEALKYVKGYIVDKYKDSSTSYFPAFGIEYKNNRYFFPIDRNKRLASLVLMLQGLLDNGFGDKEFGTAFWTDIKSQYENLITQASSTDGTISTKVSAKNTLKGALKKTLNSLISVIKGNYPDTYKAELRSWGFQKEKY
ncbi:hypothetical protein [Flavobacterium sp.]|uniref:hypothetical protein n=1 Tax=Flavobacterium sp. TaxID=239 RepID=UPI0025F5D265|nr:hypothetical protein [Flavobacterium sp.]